MAYYDTVWYVHFGDGSTTGYYAVPRRPQNAAVTAGTFARQFTAPAVGSERCFICTVAGTTANTTDATWVLTRGAKTTDGTATWQECTGAAGSNGDSTNTPTWATIKASGQTPSIGAIITDNSNTSFQICSTAGTLGVSSPTFNTTPGATTNEVSATTVWTCIGLTATMPDWSAPHARLPNAFASTWGVAGNDFYIADNHAETSAAQINLNGPGMGTITTGSRVFSIDHTAVLPVTSSNLKPGASLTSSQAAAGAISIGAVQSSCYMYGLNFIASAAYSSASLMSMVNSSAGRHKFEACTFQLTGALTGSTMQILNMSSQMELINCTFGFSNAGQLVAVSGGAFAWRNTPDPCFTGTIPTNAFRGVNTTACAMIMEGIDFTSLGANTLIGNTTAGLLLTIKNCKLHTGAITGGPAIAFAGSNIDVVSSDSGTQVYRNERHNSFGDLTTSTAIYRTSGAQDGTVPVSHAIVSSSYARSWRPFECLPLVIWNDTVSATRTITVYGVVLGTTTLPYNDQVWLDVEYMGSTGAPIASFSSNGLANQLAAHAVIAVADSVSTWVGAGSTNAPFSLSVSLTPQQHGYFTIYPRVGASYSLYIDPRPVLS